MQKFLTRYAEHLRFTVKNPALYEWLLLIALGGHSPTGKCLAALASVAAVPLIRMFGPRL